MNKKIISILTSIIILTSCSGDNSKIYGEDLQKLIDSSTYSQESFFDMSTSYSEGNSLILIKYENPKSILLDFKTIIAPVNDIKTDETYCNIGYFENDPIAFNNTSNELKGYISYKTLNFAYPTTDKDMKFKVYVSFLNSDNEVKEYFYTLGGTND